MGTEVNIENAKMWTLGVYSELPYATFREAQFEHWVAQRVPVYSDLHFRPPTHPFSIARLIVEGPDNADDIGWHQDGTDGSHAYMGVWANIHPTLIKPKGASDLSTWQAAPGTLVMFDNNFFEHKIPDIDLAQAEVRYFVRFHVHVPASLRSHPDIRAVKW